MQVILFNPRSASDTGESRAREWVLGHGENPNEMKSILDMDGTALAAFVGAMTETDKLILCGGDGTLSRFAYALKDTEIRVPIYFSATGTGNDFLKDLRSAGITDDPILINPYLRDLPVVYINGRRHTFINGIGYGLDGWCCEVADGIRAKWEKKGKKSKGVNYAAIAMSGVFGRYQPRGAEVTVDGQTRRYSHVWLAPTMNGRFYGGGFKMAPFQDRLNRERLVTSVVVHKCKGLRLLPILPAFFRGTQTKHTEYYEARQGHEITVRFDSPCALQIDGETVLGVTEYTVRSATAAAKYDRECQGCLESIL